MVICDNGNTTCVTFFHIYAHLSFYERYYYWTYYLYICNVSIGLGRMQLINHLILDGVAFYIIVGFFVK